jgi:hypothetical protein
MWIFDVCEERIPTPFEEHGRFVLAWGSPPFEPRIRVSKVDCHLHQELQMSPVQWLHGRQEKVQGQ